MKWRVNQSQNCGNKRNHSGKLAKFESICFPKLFTRTNILVIDGVNCLEVWLSPQISWFRWPGESPGRRCMSEVKPGEFSITNLAIRSWDPVLWCNFVWVCLGWRNFIFQMDGSNLPYESIWSFHLNLAEVPSKFHTISELNGSQFRWNKVPERWTSGARCSAAYRRQGWGRCRFPLGEQGGGGAVSAGADGMHSAPLEKDPLRSGWWRISNATFFPNGEGTEQVWNWW